MHVLMSAGIYDIGGFSTVMEQLANNIAKKGHDVTIGALWFKNYPPLGSYNVKTIPFTNIFKLRRFLSSFDIIHNHHAITNYLPLVCHKPFIYHYHGVPDLGRDCLFKSNMVLSIKMMKNTFDSVIAVSETGFIDLKKYFDIDKIHLIYNGVDTNIFKPGLEEKFRKGNPQFLFVGNLYEHKKVEELILAMNLLVKKYPKACLQIVGSGKMFWALKNLITKLKLQDNVELVGRVSAKELPYRYASCDAYVTASRWELFGLPLLETMACGKPFVASSIPPHLELLNKSKGGEVYPIGDFRALSNSMMKIYTEHENYKDNAINFAIQNDWSIVANQILENYYKVCKRSVLHI
jgi:glycosyltransferase involved in cell wall biosynthesis